MFPSFVTPHSLFVLAPYIGLVYVTLPLSPDRPAQPRTEGNAGQHVLDKENPVKETRGFACSVRLYPEMASYLL